MAKLPLATRKAIDALGLKKGDRVFALVKTVGSRRAGNPPQRNADDGCRRGATSFGATRNSLNGPTLKARNFQGAAREKGRSA
jgi:hypothetical protein